jgi:zinc transport system substrate-binding protein
MKIFKLIIPILLVSLFLSACSSFKENEELNYQTASTENKKMLTITASFYPVYIMALNITKDVPNIKLLNLTNQATGCLHDYSLTTDDMKKLEATQILIVNGAEMESFMDKVIKQQNLQIIDSSTGIEVIKDKENQIVNPHIWVSISNAIKQVENISNQLAELDLENALLYKKNSKQYIEKLKIEQTKMQVELKDVKNKNIVTFHEAFPYFAKEFNLNIVGVIEREPGSEPTPKELVDTINIIKELDVKAIFAEPQYSQKAAITIANETGIIIYTLDPGVTGAFDADAYLTMMDKNLSTLKEALK